MSNLEAFRLEVRDWIEGDPSEIASGRVSQPKGGVGVHELVNRRRDNK